MLTAEISQYVESVQNNPDKILVDSRERLNFLTEHIPSAKNIPYTMLGDDNHILRPIDEIKRFIENRGISPDAEPSPKKLAEVIDTAKKHNIKAVFFESLVSDRLAQVLAKEIGALVLALNPGANVTREQIQSGVTFLSIMEKNLNNLQEGLICEE